MPHGGTQGLSKVPCLTEEEERFPLSKPVVGQNIALHAVPAYRTSTYLVSAFLGSFNFISSKFIRSSTVECVLSCESEILLVVGIHFVSP